MGRRRKVNPNFNRYLYQQKLQGKIVVYLRNLGLCVEGRMNIYMSDFYYRKGIEYGYTPGLPQIEIHNPRNKFLKCGIYLKKLDSDDIRVMRILEDNGYKILIYERKITFDELKISILKNYLKKTPNVKIRNTKKKISKIDFADEKVEKIEYVKEKNFHRDLISQIRKQFGKDIILEGRLQGNIGRKKVVSFSNRMGYILGSADLTIKNPSSSLKYKHLDIELKIKSLKPRKSQIDQLLFFKKFKHFPAYVNIGKGNGVEKGLKLINLYLNGPDSELKKYML